MIMEYVEYPKGFKQLLTLFIYSYDEESMERAEWELSRSINAGKLNNKEIDLLYMLADRIRDTI